MKVTRKRLKLKSILLAAIMLPIVTPIHSVLAAMIGTLTLMNSARDQEPANISTSSGVRIDVQDGLIAQGIISYVILQKEKHRYIPKCPLTIKLKIRSKRHL